MRGQKQGIVEAEAKSGERSVRGRRKQIIGGSGNEAVISDFDAKLVVRGCKVGEDCGSEQSRREDRARKTPGEFSF